MGAVAIVFFKSAAELRRWLQKNHAGVGELWIGFYKKGADRRGVTYTEALDQALCFGWIDGIRKAVDAGSYTIRFTPRRPGSIWSLVNTRRVRELRKRGLMHAAGLRAFQERDPEKSERYSYEQRTRGLSPIYERKFRAHRAAWTFFQAQPPGYRRTAGWWVVSAAREETRLRRLDQLIADSAQGRRLGLLARTPK